MSERRRPPEELADGRVALHRFRTADAESLHEAVVASIGHLRPWMPWAAEGALTVAGYRDLIDEWWEAWSARVIYPFRICDPTDTASTLGACGLHARIEPAGLELGYWIRPDRTRRGLATSAARLATSTALDLDGIDHVEIHHDAANIASRGVPEALGFEMTIERDKEPTAPGDTGREVVWRAERTTWVDPTTRGAGSGGSPSSSG